MSGFGNFLARADVARAGGSPSGGGFSQALSSSSGFYAPLRIKRVALAQEPQLPNFETRSMTPEQADAIAAQYGISRATALVALARQGVQIEYPRAPKRVPARY